MNTKTNNEKLFSVILKSHYCCTGWCKSYGTLNLFEILLQMNCNLFTTVIKTIPLTCFYSNIFLHRMVQFMAYRMLKLCKNDFNKIGRLQTAIPNNECRWEKGALPHQKTSQCMKCVVVDWVH